MAKTQDYYRILDVPFNANDIMIRRAYVQRRREIDSFIIKRDRDEQDIRDLIDAVDALADPKRRKEYNLKTFGEVGPPPIETDPQEENEDPNREMAPQVLIILALASVPLWLPKLIDAVRQSKWLAPYFEKDANGLFGAAAFTLLVLVLVLVFWANRRQVGR